MGKFSKENKSDGILPVFLWIFLVVTVAVFLILTAAFLSQNGTFAEWKSRYAEWKEDREATKRAERAGEKTVHYFGPSDGDGYENWFAGTRQDVLSGGAENKDGNKATEGEGDKVTDPLREVLTASPVDGSEGWWSTAKKLSGEVTLYAQARAPLYGAPDAKGTVLGYGMAGEAFSLLAVLEDGWYVVSDGVFYYCSQGKHYTMVQLQAEEPEAAVTGREKQKVFHEVDTILQNPELPHGCEVTGLAILLSYYGIEADKCELADVWLPKGVWGQTDFRKAFVGDPRKTKASAGCFAPVIADTANRYLEEEKLRRTGNEPAEKQKDGGLWEKAGADIGLTAVAKEGVSFSELLSMIEEAPVLAWITMNLEAPYIAQIWEVDGEELYWQNYEHCVVLTGYDAEKGVLYGTDPLYGPCEYDAELFSIRFQTMYSQVVQIVEDTP